MPDLECLKPEEAKSSQPKLEPRESGFSFEELEVDDQTKKEALIVHNHHEGKTQSFSDFKIVQE